MQTMQTISAAETNPVTETPLRLPTRLYSLRKRQRWRRLKSTAVFWIYCTKDGPKFHEGQRCVAAVPRFILGLGGYDDFPFGIPAARNSNGSEMCYASSYGIRWFLFLDQESPTKISQCVRPVWAYPKHPNRCTTYHEGWKMRPRHWRVAHGWLKICIGTSLRTRSVLTVRYESFLDAPTNSKKEENFLRIGVAACKQDRRCRQPKAAAWQEPQNFPIGLCVWCLFEPQQLHLWLMAKSWISQ